MEGDKMRKYSKIQSIFKRVQEGGPDKGKMIDGAWTKPEFELLKDLKWEATEKIDGTNIRVDWDGEKVTFGGRTDKAQIPAHLVARLMDLFSVEKFATINAARDEPLPPMTIFGEGYGEKIQAAGKDYMPNGGVDLILFDVWAGSSWWSRDAVQYMAGLFGLDTVQDAGPMTLEESIAHVEGGFRSNMGIGMAEGLVLRAPLGLCDHNGSRLIVKVKTRDFVRGMVQ